MSMFALLIRPRDGAKVEVRKRRKATSARAHAPSSAFVFRRTYNNFIWSRRIPFRTRNQSRSTFAPAASPELDPCQCRSLRLFPLCKCADAIPQLRIAQIYIHQGQSK